MIKNGTWHIWKILQNQLKSCLKQQEIGEVHGVK
jgi:hypothetical protein